MERIWVIVDHNHELIVPTGNMGGHANNIM